MLVRGVSALFIQRSFGPCCQPTQGAFHLSNMPSETPGSQGRKQLGSLAPPRDPIPRAAPFNPPHLQPCPTGTPRKPAPNELHMSGSQALRARLLVPPPCPQSLGGAFPDSSSPPAPPSGHPPPVILPIPSSQGGGHVALV